MNYVLGIKKGMTRMFVNDKAVPVTVVDTSGCVVSLKSEGGIELGIGSVKPRNKAIEGKYKAIGRVPKYRVWIKGDFAELNVGDAVQVTEVAEGGQKVKITATSKGKGFAGVVKRWGFAGGPKTHGQSDRLRAPGSIGAGTTPGRVFKGKKMGGRMGSDKVTVSNKKLVAVNESFAMISGAVPGAKEGLVIIQLEK